MSNAERGGKYVKRYDLSGERSFYGRFCHHDRILCVSRLISVNGPGARLPYSETITQEVSSMIREDKRTLANVVGIVGFFGLVIVVVLAVVAISLS